MEGYALEAVDPIIILPMGNYMNLYAVYMVCKKRSQYERDT